MNLTSSSTDEYIMPPPWINQLKPFTSSSIKLASDSPDTYFSIVGHFPNNSLIGVRSSGIQFDVLDTGEAVDGSGNQYSATRGFGKFLRIHARLDHTLIYPAHMSVMSGIVA